MSKLCHSTDSKELKPISRVSGFQTTLRQGIYLAEYKNRTNLSPNALLKILLDEHIKKEERG